MIRHHIEDYNWTEQHLQKMLEAGARLDHPERPKPIQRVSIEPAVRFLKTHILSTTKLHQIMATEVLSSPGVRERFLASIDLRLMRQFLSEPENDVPRFG